MKMLVVVLVALSIATVSLGNVYDLGAHWDMYKARFNKTYPPDEDAARRAIFEWNFFAVAHHNFKHNLGLKSYSIGINQFSDMTSEELQALKGVRVPANESFAHVEFELLDQIDIPDSVDWRTKDRVTPVKNQGGCGSCWAFSATGSMEGAHAKTTGRLVSLSEQELVDCDKRDNGCGGGWMNQAFQYVIQHKGISTEASYPYKAIQGQCRRGTIGATIQSFKQVPQSEKALQNAVATVGPISVAIYASDQFMAYTGGIYNEFGCNQDLPNHGVLVVGYGTENGKDYWIVKNSWGATWGEAGYVRMARNVNLCGIANYASYPIA